MNEDELVDLLKWQDRARDEPYAGNNTQIMVEIVPDLIAEVRRLQKRVDELCKYSCHEEGCEAAYDPEYYKCRCGYDDLLADMLMEEEEQEVSE